MKMMTLDKLLANTSDGELLDIYLEIDSGVVPASGYAKGFCRRVNNMIDRGTMCINPTTYRKVYLPTLVKALHKELADRYITSIRMGDNL